MSIKDLFEINEDNLNLLSETNQKDAFKDVESERNLEQLKIKQDTYTPPVDYSNPVNFARYGSAYYYYKGAIERIHDYYPYDGSDAEINKFYNELLDVEKYVFDNLYPRTHGYINLAVTGWGDVAAGTDLYAMQGYGTPDEKEYITLKGGPGIGGNTTNLATMSPDDYSSKFQYSNVYDTDIYTTAGLESDYGKGTRESNLKSDFDTGITVEFWLKKEAFAETKSTKEVVFDMWVSGALSSSADYGRLTLELTGGADVAGSPLLLTAFSGATGFYQSSIGKNITLSGNLNTWNHFAFVMQNTGSDFVSKFYFNGTLNDTYTSPSGTMGELQQSGTIGRIGSLLTAPSGATNYANLNDFDGTGKLSASMDEFRFWKVARTGQDVGRYWFDQVRGGTNTDISNTTLGVYYKFNEGITGTASSDNIVLDYAGRITNGTWTGYGPQSRATGSAILEAGAAVKEYKDPIVYSSHPNVVDLKNSLTTSGSNHDTNNNSAFINYSPSWVLEEHENVGNDNLKIMSHIMGSYFDKLYLLSQFLPKIRGAYYPSGSEQPIPFARNLPQSLGLYVPEAFIDASVMETFLNRNDTEIFEDDVKDIKNTIYLNLYNNLTNIYKSKGTEKAVRNVLRCFNVDESLVKVNTYSNNQTFELANNYEQVLEKRSLLNLSITDNRSGIIYQRYESNNTNSIGYISGSQASGSAGTQGGYESLYGATVEADVVFPSFFYNYDYFDRNYTDVSLFGMHTVNTASADSLTGVETSWVEDDKANFQVYAIKSSKNSKNAYFKLTSNRIPNPLPELTSSTFVNVYDNTQWNLSVRLVPDIDPLAVFVSSSGEYDYKVIFEGYNTNIGIQQNHFVVSSSITHEIGSEFLTAAKRLYLGSERTNFTGSVVTRSDVFPSSMRYWMKSIDDTSIIEHSYDLDNHGISGSYKNTSPLDPYNKNRDVLNKDTLALNWQFNDITGSDLDGNFDVTDYSSGSTSQRSELGWMGAIAGYQHTGYGLGFVTSSADVVSKKTINTFKFIEPERVISSDAVKVLSEDDQVFGVVETVPSYVFTIEKSMYRAISEEMLNFFAGVVDFNNLIGAPVNRYRERYKDIQHLRESFFQRVTEVSEVEKFISYYKWFDDTIATVIAQLMPASAEFVNDTYNVVESHVLERNKYQTKYPTLEDGRVDISGEATGIGQLGLNYAQYSTTLPRSPRPTNEHSFFWKNVADRRSVEITSGDINVDTQRNRFKDVINTSPRQNTTAPNFKNIKTELLYKRNFYGYRNYHNKYEFKVEPSRKLYNTIKGGVNFTNNKNIGFTYNALYPFSPISDNEDRYIPLNVLLALEEDLVKITDFLDDIELKKNITRNIKVQFGRGYGDHGFGYPNTDALQAFPFQVVSASVNSGYNKQIVDGFSSSVQVTNLHNDVYGPDMEVPMQGPFTDYAVGGHQSRHIAINSGSDTWQNRPEGWKLLLGECKAGANNGAIGMVGPDYPIEALGKEPVSATGRITIAAGNVSAGNYVTISDGDVSVKFQVGALWTAGGNANASTANLATAITNYAAFDVSATADENIISLANTKYGTASSKNRNARGSLGNSVIVKSGGNITVAGMSGGEDPRVMNYNVPRAVYYREETAKRPVNIRNILTTTGSTIIGNYSHNYEVVSTVGAYSNPRNFIETQPSYPSAITSRPNILSGATVANSYMTRFENEAAIANSAGQNHINIPVDYTVASGTINKSVITSRFNAPGGPETMQRGFQDFRSSEFAIYSTTTYRNLPVLDAGHANEQNAQSQVAGFGYIVNDIHDRPIGLRQHLTRHSARFGRDSQIVTGVDSSDNGPGASYDQSPAMFKIPRNRRRKLTIVSDGSIETGSAFDNSYVQRAIPTSDLNYAWINSTVETINNHFGYFPPDYLIRRGDNYVDPVTFVSASDVVSFVDGSGNRKFGAGKPVTNAARKQHMFTDFVGINFHVYDPIGASSSAGEAALNSTGYSASSVPLYATAVTTTQYANRDVIITRAAPYNTNPKASAGIFNALMLHRNGPYGWPTWKQARVGDNPTTRHEIKNNYISVVTGTMTDIAYFDLRPVSMRGRPGVVNFNTVDVNNTIKATHSNNKILFNQSEFNDFVGLSAENLTSVFDQLNDILGVGNGYSYNWALYTENIFPQEKNEFSQDVRSRIGYENYFWRSAIANRVTLGDEVNNSFGLNLDQSAWSTDAGLYFTSRTASLNAAAAGGATYSESNFLAVSAPSGELQNQYVHIVSEPSTGSIATQDKVKLLKPGALYARKHCLTSPASTVGPSGISRSTMLIDLSGADVFDHTKQLQLFGGEAAYQSDTLAGKLVITGESLPQWQVTPTAPWFNNYDDFKYDLMKVAKDYVVVPEYRISEHVSDLLNNASDKTNWFEIPGTSQNSSDSEFYKTYSNSEFLKDFLNIKDVSLLDAKEIMIEVSAIKRFNPYKGFYPAQRTLDLTSQFKSSYLDRMFATYYNEGSSTHQRISGSEIFAETGGSVAGGAVRPLIQALYAPGIMYNTIKSGMAVDYPIITDNNKIKYRLVQHYRDDDSPVRETQNWCIDFNSSYILTSSNAVGYAPLGELPDQRLPFQTILRPEKYLNNVLIADIEPHPSASLSASAGLIGGNNDELYTMMAQNFFGQVADFYLEGQQFTKLQSQVMSNEITVPSGSTYAARIKLKRSVNSGRIYSQESSSAGTNYGYSSIGGAYWDPTNAQFEVSGAFEIPQDPRQLQGFKETFTMYSRPTAFGPAFMSARTLTAGGTSNETIQANYSPLDSVSGYNWMYTPPYTNGEAWVDVVWTSDGAAKSVNDILTEADLIYRRCDPGYQSKLIYDPASVVSASGGSVNVYTIYGGRNINYNAMQISASIDLLGVEEVQGFELSKDGTLDKQLSNTVGSRWVIQPKFETPMLNFNDEGVNPITYGNKTQPIFAATSAPNGIWHQFGNLPSGPNKGIFMEIDDVPEDWLRYHYDVTINNSAYNKNNSAGEGPTAYKNVKSLVDLFGFDKTSQKARLGELPEEKIIKEAVVAVPYIIESVEPSIEKTLSKTYLKERKKFISIERYNEIVNSDSIDTVGESIRKLSQKIERYVLPPQLDFVSNSNLDPIAMYIFEFEYKVTKDDLAHWWQNTAHEDYAKMEFEKQSIAHELLDTELLNADILSDNQNLRWMVFKVKQRAKTTYDDLTVSQATAGVIPKFLNVPFKNSKLTGTPIEAFNSQEKSYNVGYNWPYDYLSFVELIKVDAKILFKKKNSPGHLDGLRSPSDFKFQTGDGDTITISSAKQTAVKNNRNVKSTRGRGVITDNLRTSYQPLRGSVTPLGPTNPLKVSTTNQLNTNITTGKKGGGY
jgi:hypothetical protein